ncbi:MAG TPA: helix-turn-helix transcriptional regulator [Myxococcaceae bacterium]|nr:helix-turn-helix transcriptional regulator [Myxococcaceae bacterium]
MEEELQTNLGQVARAARERLGLTQAQVAKQVDLVPGVYGRIERGDMLPSVPSLRRICLALGLSADALLGLASSEVSTTMEGVPAEAETRPELLRIVLLLRTWSASRLKVLSKVLNILASAEED